MYSAARKLAGSGTVHDDVEALFFLEEQQEILHARRRELAVAHRELRARKEVEMTWAEKQNLCMCAAQLDFDRMTAVAAIIAQGMNRPDLLNEVEFDMDIDEIDNFVLRDVQFFLQHDIPNVKIELHRIDQKLARVHIKIANLRRMEGRV